jgi:hypothetical protein
VIHFLELKSYFFDFFFLSALVFGPTISTKFPSGSLSIDCSIFHSSWHAMKSPISGGTTARSPTRCPMQSLFVGMRYEMDANAGRSSKHTTSHFTKCTQKRSIKVRQSREHGCPARQSQEPEPFCERMDVIIGLSLWSKR